MRQGRFIIQSLWYYRKRNLLLAFGIAISTAVLTGALIVGDSVKYSLGRIVEYRLGKTDFVMQSGDRFFTEELTSGVREELNVTVSGLLKVEGSAIAEGGELRVNQIQVYGVDASFDRIAGTNDFYASLNEDSVIISSNLADRLNVRTGDEVLLRLTRASLVPPNAPFVSDEDNIVAIHVGIKAIAGKYELGSFNTRNSQTAPFNLFISGEYLRHLMEIGNKSNLMLLSGDQLQDDQISSSVRSTWSIDDAGLYEEYNGELQLLTLKSDRVFIDSVIAGSLESVGENGEGAISYFVNTITYGQHSTPYSFVSTKPSNVVKKDEILINSWLADDLGCSPGDSVRMEYFVVGPLRDLDTSSAVLKVREIISMDHPFCDPVLMPDIPGLSDAGNCRDWETGVPIDLDDIRDKDEDYWNKYHGTPKAFINSSVGEQLWANRFGRYTSYQYKVKEEGVELLNHDIMLTLEPRDLGFEFVPVRKNADYAAENGVDFSELFGGLSFFLLAGAIILSLLLFRLNFEERREQVGTLSAMGIPGAMIRRLFFREQFLVAVIGGVIGSGFAILYNKMIFKALNSIWSDIVRTQMLSVDIRLSTLLIGLCISVLLAALFIRMQMRIQTGKEIKKHLLQRNKGRFIGPKLAGITSLIFLAASLVIVIFQLVNQKLNNASLFFASGGLLLLAGILISYYLLLKMELSRASIRKISSLSRRNAVANLTRSMSIIILLAVGIFIVISTGSNRKDLFANADNKSSGTGGFLYYSESTIPVLQNLNNKNVRYKYGMEEAYQVVQMRLAAGDDASCLNLNKISNPKILGVDPFALEGRFSFVTHHESLPEERPWSGLNNEYESGVVPAIADETVIKWGLEMEVGDTLVYQDAMGNPFRLLLIGGLAPSVFQGHVMISEKNFLKFFPTSSGSNVFLIDGEDADSTKIAAELNAGMRDMGWTMEYCAGRLARFNSITNTYLSIFLILGALGLLIGTVALAIVLFRTVLERAGELALLRAVGYSQKTIRNLISLEYLFLLLMGILTGSLSAVIATLPSLLSRNTSVSLGIVFVIILIVTVNGVIWIQLMARLALRSKTLITDLRSE